MPSAPGDPAASPALTELPEPLRQRALERCHKLRPHLEQDVPPARVAAEASLPLRTAQQRVRRYRRFGLAGLAFLESCRRVADMTIAFIARRHRYEGVDQR